MKNSDSKIDLRALKKQTDEAFENAADSIVEYLSQYGNDINFLSNSIPFSSKRNILKQFINAKGVTRQEQLRFAKMLLISSLLNHNNPDWNPLDPTTNQPNYDDPLVALLLAKFDNA